jgi:hypothetical protein
VVARRPGAAARELDELVGAPERRSVVALAPLRPRAAPDVVRRLAGVFDRPDVRG